MTVDLIARTSIEVDATAEKVWEALLDPEKIKRYMFGTTVETTWQPGSPITWSGVWEGKPYQDKGVIVRCEPEQVLEYTHYSPLTGKPDIPSSYHTVRIEFAHSGNGTRLTLTQNHNDTEEARAHSEKNWKLMLAGIKQIVER